MNKLIRQIINQTQKNYNIISSHFSAKRKFLWPELKPFLKYVKKESRVLDVGCGNGRLYSELKKYIRLNSRSRQQTNSYYSYLGIDFSKNLLQIAQQKYPLAKFKLADITKRKTWQNLKNFDVCFCLAVLHHLPTRRLQLAVLEQIYRSLENKGILVLSVWNLWQKKYFYFHWQQIIWKIYQGFKFKWLKMPYKVSNGQKIIEKVDRFCYCFSSTELKNLMEKAGFKIIEQKKGKNLCLIGQKVVK